MTNDSERQAFEAWAGNPLLLYCLDRDDNNDYEELRTRHAYQGWYARAKQANTSPFTETEAVEVAHSAFVDAYQDECVKDEAELIDAEEAGVLAALKAVGVKFREEV
jgi:hypothetical protein